MQTGLESGFYSGVAVPGSVDYFGLLFCPQAERENFRLLLAFEKLIHELSSTSIEQEVLQAKLRWWAEEMSRIAGGKPVHPLALAVSELLNGRQILPAPLLELFSAVASEAMGELPGSPDELLEHASSRGALLSVVAALLVPAGSLLSAASQDACKEIGAGRYLALVFNASHRDHQQAVPAGHDSAQGEPGLEQRLATAQIQRMQEKLGLIPQTERPLLVPLLVMSGLILDSLRVIDTDGNAGRPSQLRTLIRAWKTAWRASRGKLPF